MSPPPEVPKMAVALATVHRPQDIVEAVSSALRLEYPRFEIRIIDQSEDGRTEEGVRPLLEDPRLHYQRQDRRGLAAALNAAAAATDAQIIAITGDDCVMRQKWLQEIAGAFARDDGIGIVFGTVIPGRYEGADGFVPGCLIDAETEVHSIAEVHRLNGTTANMAVRRSVWRELHGFDERFGVGAPLRSAEDLDFALRGLLAGHHVLQTPGAEVEHRSPTLWSERATTIRRNWFGSGAAFGKGLKLSPIRMSAALARLGGRWAQGGSAVAATYGPRPSRMAMLSGFTLGFLIGLLGRVDRQSRHFRVTDSA